jgi:hypothetical protein
MVLTVLGSQLSDFLELLYNQLVHPGGIIGSGRKILFDNQKRGKMRILFGILLLLHGFIVCAQSSVSFKPVGGTPNPAWMAWFPVNLGQSWLFAKTAMEQAARVKVFGILWLVAGIALILAALGVLHFIIPLAWWRIFALIGAQLSLLMLLLYFHPFYLIGFSASLILLIAILSKSWGVLTQMGL